MLKKRIALIGLLLVLSIAGQVVLRPCLGSGPAEDTEQRTTSPSLLPASELDNETDTLQSGLWRTFFYMLGFVAMIGIGAWLICRKFACGWSGPAGQVIRIKETVRMGPRKAVHLIRVGDKTFLVGSTSDSVSLLADVSDSVEAHGGTTNA